MIKGGLSVDASGLYHYEFNHNPSTLRLAAGAALTMPRSGPVRKMFVAPPGWTFWARDFSGIEAVLVGWFARSDRYQRLAKIDIHAFYTAYALYELEKAIPYDALPQEKWPDDQLALALSQIKREFKQRRQNNKIMVHGGNYLMGPFEAQETQLKELGVVVPMKDIKRLQGFYNELFPEIGEWHQKVTGKWANGLGVAEPSEQENAHQRTWLRTPFGNWHHYYHVLDWSKAGSGWEAKYGPDAKRSVAFLPQSSGRFILTRSMQRLAQDVQDTVRLLLHDEILGICRTDHLSHCLEVSKDEMERPIPELNGLVIGTEAKAGTCWGELQTVMD